MVTLLSVAALAGCGANVAPAMEEDVGQTEQAATIAGNTPWAVLLCKYSDQTATPLTKTVAEQTFTESGPGSLFDYWHDNSRGAIGLDGSVVDDWKTINTMAHYQTGHQTTDRYALFDDCIAAHPGVSVTTSTRVLVYTNADNGHTSGGYSESRLAGGAILEAGAYKSLYLAGQEMGHAYGLQHAFDDNGTEYADEWDVMGDAGVGLSSAEKYALGWVPAALVATRATGLPSYELSAPFHATGAGWAMIKLDDPADATHYYTVEYRQAESWDAQIQTNGVVIHEVQASGRVVLQRVQPLPGVAALMANNSSWTSPNGKVYVGLTCLNAANGSATVTVDPAAYSQCGSGFKPPSTGGTTYSGGSGSLNACPTCPGAIRKKPIQFM